MTAVGRVQRRHVVAAVLYGLLLAGAVFAPLHAVPFWDYLDRRFGIVWTPRYETALDVLVNVVLLVPAGFLAHGWWRGGAAPAWRATLAIVLAAAGLSTVAEALQWLSGWRTVSALDIVSAAAGAALGCGVERLVPRRPAPPAAAVPGAPAAGDS